jgi:hypothetical protein
MKIGPRVWRPERNGTDKRHRDLVPYDELPESEREYDRTTAMETLKALLRHPPLCSGVAGLRRFLSNDIPSCLSFRPSSVLRQPFHRSTMRLLSRLDDERKSGAIWYVIFRQSPNVSEAG